MSKLVLDRVKVVVNNVVFDGHAFNVDTPQEKEQVDVSGFSTREYLPGLEDSSLVIQFLQDFGTTSSGDTKPVHNTLYPLYASGTAFGVYVLPRNDAGTAADNPAYGGTAVLYTYNGLSGALNARAELTATFRPAGGVNFAWGTTTPGTV